MQDKQQPSEELEHSIEEGHETRDLPVRGILIFGILLLLMLGIIFVVVTSIQFSVIGQPPPVRSPSEGLGNAPAPPTPPQPALLVVPGVAYQDFWRRNKKHWVPMDGWTRRQESSEYRSIARWVSSFKKDCPRGRLPLGRSRMRG